MQPIVSFVATLVFFGVAFPLLHVTILWLGLPDLAALLLFAIPVIGYISYCTNHTRAAMLRSAVGIYAGFALIVLGAGGLAVFIG